MSSRKLPVDSRQADGLRSLPEGWAWTTIGDVADTTSGGTPSRKYPEYFQGSIPWVKSGELGDGFITKTEENITDEALRTSNTKLFPSGTVLVALYGATVGKVGILKIDSASNQAVCALFPRKNSFTAKYMFYWLMSQRQELINKSVGGAQPNISQSIVRSHPIPLSPLPEQARIVARLEELLSDLEAGVTTLERVRAGAKRFKASMLKAACEGKLFGDKGLEKGELPEGWAWTTIGDVADTTSGGTPSRKNPEYFQGTIPWVKSGELGDGFISKTDEKITDNALRNSSAKLFPTGTILVALYGATVGKVGILKIDAASNQAVCALFPRNNSFTAKYMFYWLMSQRQELINKSKGGAQPNISQSIVRSHPFPLAPLPEQDRIVEEIERRLESAQGVESAVKVGLTRARRLRQSVLRSAFEGRL